MIQFAVFTFTLEVFRRKTISPTDFLEILLWGWEENLSRKSGALTFVFLHATTVEHLQNISGLQCVF